MIYYNYNPTTKEYTFQSTALEDPRHPGRYLLPGSATFIAPPRITEEHKVAVFNENLQTWEIKDDYRGTKYCEIDENGFFKQEKTIEEIGINLDGKITIPPPSNLQKPKWDATNNTWIEGLIEVEKEETTYLYKKQTYNSAGRLLSEEIYKNYDPTTNTYSNKIEETIYKWQGNILLSKTIRSYDDNGNLVSESEEAYTKNGNVYTTKVKNLQKYKTMEVI